MEKNTQLLPGKAGIKPVITEIIRNAGEILKLELGLLESAFHEIEIIFSTVTIFHICVFFAFGYLILWIWQTFKARSLAKIFNESVKASGREPW